jgi:FkbM family methyltransferase
MVFTRALMNLSFQIRQNPFRFLFNDYCLNLIDILDADEMAVFQRRWPGPIWVFGASVGKYSKNLAQNNPNQKVYCFEPNLNTLYYLAYRTASLPNVVIVPMAVTSSGGPIKASYHPDFNGVPTGPQVPTLSLQEAVAKFGRPAFVKIDIEGEEYNLLRDEPEGLRGSCLMVEWHPINGKLEIPKLKHWKATRVKDYIVLYEPLTGAN